MPKYIIERELPGAGALTHSSLQKIARQSCDTINEMGSQVQWLETFVTADKCYCIYIAENEQLVKEHARRGGFPANAVNEVMAMMDPVTAEAVLAAQ